jgi:CheY-like chemotaxis protein
MKTILIVDDEIDIAETLQSFLELNGYRVIIAFDGQEALHKVLEQKPDLIITDMMMPRMDGAELIEKIRATPAIKDTRIITMSANQWPHELPFFRKPFSPRDLIAEVHRMLDGAR